MQFLDGANAKEWIAEQVKSGRPGTLAVAFWGEGAIKELGFNKRKGSNKLTIICNLRMGGTNPFEIESLMKIKGIEVLQSDTLHGKVYLFGGEKSNDAAEVLIGSSNVSSNGLAFGAAENSNLDEANVVIIHPSVIADVEKWLKKLAFTLISNDDLKEAISRFNNRPKPPKFERRNISVKEAGHSLIAKTIFEPEAFKNVSFAISRIAITEKDAKDAKVSKSGTSNNLNHDERRKIKDWNINHMFYNWGIDEIKNWKKDFVSIILRPKKCKYFFYQRIFDDLATGSIFAEPTARSIKQEIGLTTSTLILETSDQDRLLKLFAYMEKKKMDARLCRDVEEFHGLLAEASAV